MIQKINPCFWFDDQAEESAQFYTSIFKNSKINAISYYTEVSPKPAGTVLTVDFQLEGQDFTALNGGPEFTFNPAISLCVNCDTQAEIDYYWDKLLEGGEVLACGWLTDRFGVSWQIIPAEMGELMSNDNPERASRVMEELLKMKKIDLATLQRAYEQATVAQG